MADVPIWALGGHSRATKDALQDTLISMRDRSGIAVPESVWRTKAAMVAFIEAERRAYWDQRHETALESRTAEATRKAPSADRLAANITASECNEFLRSLPPMPIYGDPGCPFQPTRTEDNHG